ncbi:MAG: YbaB/EbfC family nucleoid-associated protein [Anaerolineales bacterium]|nr:YbaB/EbfC family nucleoid-associated protein [Anaerolineales bacterium]
MTKKKRRPPGIRTPSGKGPKGMMAQIQKMQEEMTQTQEQLAEELLTVTAGGGAVTVVITGDQRVESIKIDPDLLDPEEKDILEDLLVAAVNQAVEQAKGLASDKMGSLTAGLNLPGLEGLGL